MIKLLKKTSTLPLMIPYKEEKLWDRIYKRRSIKIRSQNFFHNKSFYCLPSWQWKKFAELGIRDWMKGVSILIRTIRRWHRFWIVKLISSNWNYLIFNKNGVFHTTSCEVVQIILMISDSILMLIALSRKEHNIASIKREIKNSLLAGTSRENVCWTPYY